METTRGRRQTFHGNLEAHALLPLSHRNRSDLLTDAGGGDAVDVRAHLLRKGQAAGGDELGPQARQQGEGSWDTP